MLQVVFIGLGLFAPIGEIGRVIPLGSKLTCSCEYWEIGRFSSDISADVVSFSDNTLYINAYHYTQRVKIRTFKDLNLVAGAGWYFISEELNGNLDKDKGACSFAGLNFPFCSEGKQFLSCEALYYTVPRGVSLTLNFGFKL